LTERKQLNLTGVLELINFDDKEVNLKTTKGRLLIKGKELNVDSLDLQAGNARIKGNVDSITYFDSGTVSGGNILKRMFK
jgi:sporulation protein YabP